MGRILKAIGAPLHAVETFFDRIKLGYKWRFGRFEHVRVVCYRGYGTPGALHFKGRVLERQPRDSSARNTSLWQNVRSTLERLQTKEIPGARVCVRYGDAAVELEADVDGFVDLTLRPERLAQPEAPWQEVAVELLAPEPDEPEARRATARILVPPADAEFGVISDLDDTVVRTGATDWFKQARVVLLNDARTRTPFEGVADFYRALQAGPDGRGHNPIFYVSSSPWNVYDLMLEILEVHDIPVGPILLKDFGFGEGKFVKRGHDTHKLEWIRRLLRTYPRLPFVLIGDSGQHDPEIYRQAVDEHPDRIAAVYIRDVAPPKRDAEVRAIADAVAARGVPMVLVADTRAAAEHARGLGLVPPADP